MPLFGCTTVTDCDVAIECTSECLHAEVTLLGAVVGPGDEVIVHDAPIAPDAEGRIACRRQATVRGAGPLGQMLAYLAGYLALTELIEIGFSAGRDT
jgi:hypothetical protein